MKYILLFAYCSVFTACSHTSAPELAGYECTAAREYITTLNYLNDEKGAKRAPAEVSSIALQVAKGCDGAARRYIAVRDLLLEAKLSGKTSHQHALAFALNIDARTDAFIDIFSLAYERKGLDMSSQDALRIALRLSAEYQGDPTIAGSEFVTLTKYCIAVESLNLPRPMCAQIAEQQMIAAESHRLPFADDMIELIGFLRDDEIGPKLTTKDAVELSSKLISNSPFSGPNFIRTYEFTSSTKNVPLSRDQMIGLARDVALLTKFQSPTTTER